MSTLTQSRPGIGENLPIPASATEPEGVTVPLACRRLGISTSLGYELIASGRFPCRTIRAGRRIIIPRAELDRVLGCTDAA